MDHDTIALLQKVLTLLNSVPRFTRKRLGLDSYEVAAEIETHLRKNGA